VNERWLSDILADGPIEARLVRNEADAAGVPWRTLNRAEARLGIRTYRVGYGKDGKWFWALPSAKAATDHDSHELASNAIERAFTRE
jgi:hypothetical protein